ALALAARVKRPGKEFVGQQRELYLLESNTEETSPYERLLSNAIAGDHALFASEETIEAAWAIVDPVLQTHDRAIPYPRGSWGPRAADAMIAAYGGWHNPAPEIDVSEPPFTAKERMR